MPTSILYLVHGTTTDNEKHVSSGWYDVALSPLGIKQSIELKDLLKDQHIDVVFCSDLKRSIDSAQLTFGNDIPIIIDPRLRECNYGTYNALPSDIVEPLQEKYIKERFPEGESYEDVKSRMALFLDDVQKEYAGKTIAIVAHKAPQLALDVILGGKSREQAFADDRRKKHAWQPGWHYTLP